MKKSLSLFVASSMVVSMFAGAAYAAEEKDPGAILNELGVIQGDQNGDLMEDANWSRKNVTVLMSRLLGEAEEAAETEKGHEFTDVTDAYYDGFITWAVEEGLFEGNGDGTFGYGDDMTNQQFYAVILRALGYDTKGPELFATVPDLAVEVGLTTEDTVFTAVPTRGETYATIVTALNTNVKGTSETLGVKLGLIEVTELGLGTVKQSGATSVAVPFNRAVTDEEKAELTFKLSKDGVEYETAATFSEDNKTAVLAAEYLPTGEYTVEVGEFEAVTVTIVEAVISKIEIGATAVVIADNQKLGIVVKNQFGEEVENASLNVTAYNGTKADDLSVDPSDYSVDYKTELVEKDNVIVVTASSTATGVTATKTFKAQDASAITSMKLETVQPLEGSARITAGDDALVLPYTFLDANGGKVLLNEVVSTTGNSVLIDEIQFIISNTTLIDPTSVEIDGDGVITFDAEAAGTVVITALNSKSGASANVTVKIEEPQQVGKFQIAGPGKLVAQDESATFNYNAVDNYGAPIAKAEFAKSSVNGQVSFTTNRGNTVTVVFDSKGELKLNFADESAKVGSTTVYAWVDGAISSQVTIDLKAKAVPTKVSGVQTLASTYSIDGTDVVDVDSVKVLDQYGRTMSSLPSGTAVVAAVTSGTAVTTSVTSGVYSIVGDSVGAATVTVGLDTDSDGVAETGTTYSYKTTVVADDKVVDFAIDAIDTLYAAAGHNALTPGYAKAVAVTGKTADGKTVAIDQSRFITAITSSDLNVVGVTGSTIFAIDGGEVTVSAFKGATKVAELVVKTSEAAPVAAKVEFDTAEYLLGNGASSAAIKSDLEVFDQYGVAMTGSAIDGIWTSSAPTIVSVDTDGDITTHASNDGVATISYVSKNGIVGSVTVKVQ